MTTTKIEWASKVWNPLAGCSLASPGCTNCYAMKMAGRLEAMGPKPDGGGNIKLSQYQGTTQKTKAGFVWTGKVNAAPESILTAPLRQKKPTDYFVNSMSDLFHPAVPDALIDRVFAVMALCPQHVFKILTKRPDRMREYVSDDRTQGRIARVIIDWLLDKVIAWREPWPVRSIGDIDEPTDLALKQWPLPNVWKGTSVEDQPRADERIPHLLATPAALRFLSMEPLLGPVDLAPWLDPETDCQGCDDGEGYGNRCASRDIPRKEQCPWRYAVQTVTEHGPYSEDGVPSKITSEVVKLDWVIVGGESGPGARPMHPDWARSLRDQCAHASVPFFFKQWGAWGEDLGPPATGKDRIFDGNTECAVRVGDAWQYYPSGYCPPMELCTGHNSWLYRIGKKAAGRLLDGREHSEFPA